MKRVKVLSAAALTLALCGISAVGFAALSAPSDAKVGFEATGPAGLKIDGATGDLAVADSGGNVVLTVPLGNLTTGIGLRDKHMREKYLEVPKYPSAVLTVPRSALKLAPSGKVEGDVQGTVQLHGQTKAVPVHYDATADGQGFAAHGKFRINMGDFGITVPTYLGVTVKPDVDVTASFHVAGS
jgi:polyisoprenoid-binding protein YceI